MKKISNLKQKLLLTVFYIAVLCVFWLLELPCIFKALFGVECMGCGMSRAMFSALRFDFASAFCFHPMFWSMPILYLYFLIDGGIFKKKIINIIVLSFIAVGFLVNWIVKLV